MIEKVNPSHPDKIADRIAGAIVDLAYKKEKNPKVAVEVLVGHGQGHIIVETSANIHKDEVAHIVNRIAGDVCVYIDIVPQDKHLAKNQKDDIRCGDNGIFKGMPLTEEQKTLSFVAHETYMKHPADGKFILSNGRLIACQSCVNSEDFERELKNAYTDNVLVNPLGDWTGGLNVDSGATNRKLGSDMADSVTGGGLHGKDLSKADVSINIYAFLKAQKENKPVELCCAIGDKTIDGRPYSEIVKIARDYITAIGGFEKFAEWGLY